jgi:hypothetical protein
MRGNGPWTSWTDGWTMTKLNEMLGARPSPRPADTQQATASDTPWCSSPDRDDRGTWARRDTNLHHGQALLPLQQPPDSQACRVLPLRDMNLAVRQRLGTFRPALFQTQLPCSVPSRFDAYRPRSTVPSSRDLDLPSCRLGSVCMFMFILSFRPHLARRHRTGRVQRRNSGPPRPGFGDRPRTVPRG